MGKTQTSMDQLQMHSASAVHNSAWNVVYGHVVLCQDDPEAVGEVTKKLYGDLCSQLHLSRYFIKGSPGGAKELYKEPMTLGAQMR